MTCGPMDFPWAWGHQELQDKLKLVYFPVIFVKVRQNKVNKNKFYSCQTSLPWKFHGTATYHTTLANMLVSLFHPKETLTQSKSLKGRGVVQKGGKLEKHHMLALIKREQQSFFLFFCWVLTIIHFFSIVHLLLITFSSRIFDKIHVQATHYKAKFNEDKKCTISLFSLTQDTQ